MNAPTQAVSPLTPPAPFDVAAEARKLARDLARLPDEALVDLIAVADECGLSDVLDACSRMLADRLGLPDDE